MAALTLQGFFTRSVGNAEAAVCALRINRFDCVLADCHEPASADFIRRLRAMGIRDRPTAARSPWQNGYAERLIGSIRRECVDNVVVFGERHLRHLLKLYQEYYNEVRTHLSLNKDAPVPRSVQGIGCIVAKPLLGGLHHQYVRI